MMAASLVQKRVCHCMYKLSQRLVLPQALQDQLILESRLCEKRIQFFRYSSVASIQKDTGNGKLEKPTKVLLDGEMTIKKLAKKIGTTSGSVMKVLQDVGEDVDKGIHTTLDLEIAEFVALELGVTPILPSVEEWEENINKLTSVDESRLMPRPPVVTIMGHVDHGKTTLLDKLRETAVAQGEAGGITQHIGAFSVPLKSGKRITFIDTPGHAAFNAMRGRGARVTDLIVLVVSADDGVKEQTMECIKHANSANVPIIVAINKIDKHKADATRVKQELLNNGVLLEGLGGDVPYVEISALKGLNLNKLEETIIAQSELFELKADRTGLAQGVVLEAETHKQKGLMATILVQRGKLQRGNNIVAGNAFAKVRQMFNDAGKVVNEASPSMPVQLLGWRSLPVLGDHVLTVESEEAAKTYIRMKALKERKRIESEMEISEPKKETKSRNKVGKITGRRKIPLRIKLRQQAASSKGEGNEDKTNLLSVIVKADYSGSLEAVVDILNSFKSDQIQLEVTSSGVGQISENDIRMAETTKGIVYGFNVGLSKDMDQLSKRLQVPVKNFSVIYKLMDDVQEELASKLPEVPVEVVAGEANVLKMFQLTGTRKATVAGCRVKKGTLTTGSGIVWRVSRDDEIIHQGPLSSFKHGKQDVSTAKKETECGIAFEKFSDVREGDWIQCVQVTYEKPSLNWIK